MTEENAKKILQECLNNRSTDFEDDNGNIVSDWHNVIGGRFTEKLTHPVSGVTVNLDSGVIYFIVYLIPSHMSVDNLTECERSEYGMVYAVSDDGDVFIPEA